MPSADSIPDSPAASDPVASAAAAVSPVATEAARPGHDFRSPPSLLTPMQVRQLRLRYDEFARSLATRLSIYLRLEINIQVAQVQTARFRPWADAIPVPTHLTLFRVDPVDTIAFLELPPGLGLTFLDRLLGGKGTAANPVRDLTQIETAVIDEIVLIVIREWCPHGLSVTDPKPSITQHENTPKFLRTLPGETILLVATMTVEVNGTGYPMTIALPLSAIDGLIASITPAVETRRAPVKAAPPALKWNPELDNVKVSLTAGWNGFEISARRLAQLEVGDVLPVDGNIINHVEVRIAQVPKFVGRLGAAGKARAIKLLSAITT